MKYCPECGGEYRDSIVECSDCAGTALVTAEEMRRRGLLLPGERDTQRFVRAGSAEDPLSAEQFVGELTNAKIPAFAKARRGGSVDALTTGIAGPWWDILVPESQVQPAADLLAKARQEIEADADEAARAAEEEEAELETQGKSTPR